ncbi:transmembrane protein 230 isoform X1 [Protopterus annectens]|uniref:transmembrane protein 230 isoform X1 n=1 Tax=Protopterus annectens TaxID=7888 RepID=UPI001CFB98EC|nr:transmembrane protein 230 isoform X1 [Protopterus annectens]
MTTRGRLYFLAIKETGERVSLFKKEILLQKNMPVRTSCLVKVERLHGKKMTEKLFLDCQLQQTQKHFIKPTQNRMDIIPIPGKGAGTIQNARETRAMDNIRKQNDKAWPLLIIGILVFLPGFYHLRIAYYAAKGYRGYSFDDIPDFDD